MKNVWKGLVGFLSVFATLQVARAQTTVRLDQYVPPPSAMDDFAASRPGRPGHLQLTLQATLDYARDPLVWEHDLGTERRGHATLVRHHLMEHNTLSLGLFDRLMLWAYLPINLHMAGETAFGYSPDGAGIGDVGLGARVHVFGKTDGHVAFALQGSLSLPTAHLTDDASLFTGDATTTGHLQALLELRAAGFHVAGNLGVRLKKEAWQTNVDAGHEATYALSAGYTVGGNRADTTLSAELFGTSTFEHFLARESSPVEVLAGPKARFVRGATLGAAAGAGLSHGYGAPRYRVLATLGYARPGERDQDGDGIPDVRDKCANEPEDLDGIEDADGCPDGDDDHDGIPDAVDPCPREAEDMDGFEDEDGCPDVDNDKDGFADKVDHCPLAAEDADGFEDRDGCPDPDDDKDGVPDLNDRCPREAEDVDGFQDDDGCPEPDNDGDGILDADDMCPLEAETINERDDEDGCPDRIRVDTVQGKILILEPVQFAKSSATILPASYQMLGEIADVMKTRTEIGMLSIEGHTDSQGSTARNLKLSQERAESVRKFLEQRGVEAARLSATGYGETVPVDDNGTAEGRAHNRRVEFNIGTGAATAD